MHSYDYIIIGGGLAGLQLARALSQDSYFDANRIAIIEAEDKSSNDKTWCFWEKGSGQWDDFVHHSWKNASFFTPQQSISLNLGEYSYKMIRSIDFYKKVKEELAACSNIYWIKDEIQKVEETNCLGKKDSYQGKLLFDSRIEQDETLANKTAAVWQHFKGWTIECKNEAFDPMSFTLMDFRLEYNQHCCFTYVLPTSTTTALIEFTFFSPLFVQDKTYDKLLQQYIEKQLNIQDYEILEVEKGVIPMSSYPFRQHNREKHLKIGTAGGWVKASSGYSFKSTEKKVRQVIRNLKHGKPLYNKLFAKKYNFYDRIFLRILQDENELGNELLQQIYTRNKASEVIHFLEEESTLFEDLKIINRFEKAPFLRSLRKEFN
jgi:lycopene beta-cyclase